MKEWRRLRARIPSQIKRALRGGEQAAKEAIYNLFLERLVTRMFSTRLTRKTTNWAHCHWLGQRCWQNVLDLWTIQETLTEIRPALLIEARTNRGAAALYYAHQFDLMGHGRLVTIDIAKMHDLTHPRVDFLLGSSVSAPILDTVRARVATAGGPILVILDSDHRDTHVLAELDAYAPFVTPGSYVLVQDGIIDELPSFAGDRPGPLPAIRLFLSKHPEFEVDHARCDRFLVTQHPMGWLRRRSHEHAA
jgi:cephalosporin hydroxylase